MNNFLKLFAFELNRIYTLFLSLVILVFTVQTGTVLTGTLLHKASINDLLRSGQTKEEIVELYGDFNISYIIHNLWFMAPIALAVVGLLFYSVFIWYRDWLGQNTFIYRLLMLPTSRMNLFFAKLATIMLTVLSLVAIQFFLLIFYTNIVKWIIPLAYRGDVEVVGIIASSPYLSIILPSSLTGFVASYGLGLLAVMLLFILVLLERSFRIVGAIAGIAYGVFALLCIYSPEIIQYMLFDTSYLYPGELLVIQMIITVVLMGLCLFIARYLLKRKVTV